MKSAEILVIFKSAFRSVVLLLLPLAFISLIVWATAGSSSGSTSDPIFASLWIYLAAHQIPLDLYGSISGARLSLLPLGALALVFLVIRSGITRSFASLGPRDGQPEGDELNGDESRKRLLVPIFATSYSLIVLFLAVLSSLRDTVVSVKLYYALPIVLITSFASSLIAAQLMPKRTRAPWEVAVAWAAVALGFLLALSTLTTVISLAVHYRAFLDLTTVIGPGIFGGLALILIQILYLPNLFVATLGYISGAGAHIGSDSLIHPFSFELDQLPAIPLLAALPRGTFPWAIAGAIVVLVLGFLIHRKLRARFGDDKSSAISLFAFFLMTSLLGWAASGQLITDVLSQMGVSWWRFPLVMSGVLALGMAIYRIAILIDQKMRERRALGEKTE